MNDLTTTINTTNVAEQLNKWHLTNHDPFAVWVDDPAPVLDKTAFEDSLGRSSRRTSEPASKKKETSE